MNPLDGLSEKRSGRLTNHEDVLRTIADEAVVGGLTIKEISHSMVLSTSTVRHYVKDLVEAGLLGTGYAPMDRAATYWVNETGYAALESN